VRASGETAKREMGSNQVLKDRSLNSRERIEQIFFQSSAEEALGGEERGCVTAEKVL